MRVVFFGTPRAAVPALEALLGAGHEVALVVCRPDRPRGRSGRPSPPPVKEAAQAHGLALSQPQAIRTPAFLESIVALTPDVLVVVAYGRILPAPLLGAAARLTVNVHFSLLPKYRGAAPVQWALANGEEVTGVTTMRMNEALDEGDILLQAAVPIEADEHAPRLEERLAGIGAGILLDTLARLEEGVLPERPQDHALATYAPMLEPEDGLGDPALPARLVEGRVRGFDPWPGVWLKRDERRIRIVRARAVAGAATEAPPGTILDASAGAVRMACGGGSVLEILALQREGRRVLTAMDALHGRVLEPGDRLQGKPEGYNPPPEVEGPR